MRKKLNFALGLLSLAGVFGGGRISDYCSSKQESAYIEQQKLILPAENELEKTAAEMYKIENISNEIFNTTRENFSYFAPKLHEDYSKANREFMAARENFSKILCSDEMGKIVSEIKRYGEGTTLSTTLSLSSLALFLLSILGIAGKERLRIQIKTE